MGCVCLQGSLKVNDTLELPQQRLQKKVRPYL